MSAQENRSRAERGEEILEQYAAMVHDEGENRVTIIADLLTDLRHHCTDEPGDFAAALGLSEMHYDCEIEESRRNMPDGAILFSPDDPETEEITEESRCIPAPITIRKIKRSKP